MAGSKHIFQRYFDKHGHFPHVVIDSGVQRITVEFAPGYVTIRTSEPYQACIYITRRSFLQLLRKMVPLARKMAQHPAPDHDVPAAMREAYFLEKSLLEEKRALKRAARDTPDPEEAIRRQRQRKRFLAARARAARKAQEET